MVARLRWQARRGLLELDLLLERFMDARLEKLTPGELVQLGRILQLEDNNLLDIVMGRTACHDAGLEAMIEMIRSA